MLVYQRVLINLVKPTLYTSKLVVQYQRYGKNETLVIFDQRTRPSVARCVHPVVHSNS